MDAALRRSGIAAILIGLAFQPIAPIVGGTVENATVRQMAALATTFGFAIYLFGCIKVARAKGKPWYVGLLGLLSFVGLAILWFVVEDEKR